MTTTTLNENDVAAQLAEVNLKLDRIAAVVDDLSRRLESFDDLKEDLVPIAHGALKIAHKKLHELEQDGVMDFASGCRLITQSRAESPPPTIRMSLSRKSSIRFTE